MSALLSNNIMTLRRWILAGSATFTLVSKKSGRRFTYKVQKAKNETGKPLPNDIYFIKVLTGCNNETDYAFFAYIKIPTDSHRLAIYKHSEKSRLAEEAESCQVARWFFTEVLCRELFGNVQQGKQFPAPLEVWHEGKCGRCGRKLTAPESIASGVGPECAGKM
jgi:hypothetical protein